MSYKKVKKSALVWKVLSGLRVGANNRDMHRDSHAWACIMYSWLRVHKLQPQSQRAKRMLAAEIVLFHFQHVVMSFRPYQAPHVGLFSLQPCARCPYSAELAVPAHGASGRSCPFRNGIFQVPV